MLVFLGGYDLLLLFVSFHMLKTNLYTLWMSKRIALVLRGHIRDAFSNDLLRQFLTQMSTDPRLCVHLYIQTWQKNDASPNCSWRKLDDEPSLEVTSDVLLSYIPISAYRTMILNEENAVLVGDVDGMIGGTSKLGWKRMWYGLFTIMNVIRNGSFVYDSVVSLRFDFFGSYVSGRSLDDFGRVVTTDELVEWVVASETQRISFLTEHACTGIDNCYIGPADQIFTLCACFHFNLMQTCCSVAPEFNQEKIVFNVSKIIHTQSTSHVANDKDEQHISK